jgi:hypothetical protein
MARRAAPAANDEVVETFPPNFQKLKIILLGDIRPAEEKQQSVKGDLSAAWKAVEDEAHCNKKAAKQLHRLRLMSDETRDDYLRTLLGGLEALGLGLTADLVDAMEAGKQTAAVH